MSSRALALPNNKHRGLNTYESRIVQEKNLDKQDGVTAAGALVQFGRGCCAFKAGGDKMVVKIWEGWDGDASEARDEDVLVFVLSDRQILGICGEKIEHLREKKEVKNQMFHTSIFLSDSML